MPGSYFIVGIQLHTPSVRPDSPSGLKRMKTWQKLGKDYPFDSLDIKNHQDIEGSILSIQMPYVTESYESDILFRPI